MGTFEQSFSLVSDPRTLYLTNALKDTIEKVEYTLKHRQGLTCILGDVGLGKTSILRLLNWKYEDDQDYITTMIPMPNFQSDFAMLKQICGDFRLGVKRSLYDQQKLLEAWLIEQYEKGKNVVVFIDEAQKLKPRELELIRLFLNFESFDHKLIQVVLVGQLELRDKLLDSKNKALYSRVFAPSILAPLTLEETQKMISFRSKIAEIDNPFTDDAMHTIYQLTKGVPREIVKICVYSYRQAKGIITSEIIHKVNESMEVINEEGRNTSRIIQPNAKSKTRKQKAGKQ